jgi:hypothetical protein
MAVSVTTVNCQDLDGVKKDDDRLGLAGGARAT